MEKKRWDKIEPILDAALSIENSRERWEFVHQTCDTDKLKNEVFRMLFFIQIAENEGFLE